MFTITVCNSLAETRCYDRAASVQSRTENFSSKTEIRALGSASRIVLRSLRRSRENFRESSQLAAASSRGFESRERGWIRFFALRRTIISFAYLRSVDRWRRARRHRPVAARRRSTSTEQLFCANPVASTSKRRGCVLSFSLSLSFSPPPASLPPRSTSCRAFFL